MSHVRVCECCGKNLDIEDKNNLEPQCNTTTVDKEHLHEVVVCGQCVLKEKVDQA